MQIYECFPRLVQEPCQPEKRRGTGGVSAIAVGEGLATAGICRFPLIIFPRLFYDLIQKDGLSERTCVTTNIAVSFLSCSQARPVSAGDNGHFAKPLYILRGVVIIQQPQNSCLLYKRLLIGSLQFYISGTGRTSQKRSLQYIFISYATCWLE